MFRLLTELKYSKTKLHESQFHTFYLLNAWRTQILHFNLIFLSDTGFGKFNLKLICSYD
jgi:hypothetical protein